MLLDPVVGAVLAYSEFDFDVSNAIVQSFSAAASFLGVASACVAWIALRDRLSIPEIADAAGLGLAITFLPAVVAGGYMYIDIWASGLAPT